MSILINRNPSGRLICLHALTKTLNEKFGRDKFTINDLKYDENASTNIIDFCELLIDNSSIDHHVCPYLNNPLSNARCYLTQSKTDDTQKSKSASDAMNALDGLGFVKRNDDYANLTDSGIMFGNHDFASENWLSIAKKAVLSYGPFVGMLYKISLKNINGQIKIKKSDVHVQFPQTHEQIKSGSTTVQLSTGSESDTNTRTRAIMFSWAVSTGFAIPSNYNCPTNKKQWHVETRDIVEKNRWSYSKYNFYIPQNLFNDKHYVDNPLNYSWLTKSIRSLRERGQESIRRASLNNDARIKNRRFAIVYALAKYSECGAILDFKNLIEKLKTEPDLFIINEDEFMHVMQRETQIAPLCGIPFSYNDKMMTPLTRINIPELCRGAPDIVINKIDDMLEIH